MVGGDDDPARDVELPRVGRGLPKALNEDEVARLIAAVDGDDPLARRDRAILEVLYGTGVRISELVGLSLGDVDLGDFGFFAAAFQSVLGDPNYEPAADLNNDGDVDLGDFGDFASQFGRTDCLDG